MRFLIIIFLLFLSCSFSKKNGRCNCFFDNNYNLVLCDRTDLMPTFPGGETALIEYFLANLKLKEEDEQFTYIVQFVIDSEGKVLFPNIRGKSLIELTDNEKEVLRVVGNMENWYPAQCLNKNTNFLFFLPIRL